MLVSADGREGSLRIHQNAYISRGKYATGEKNSYTLFDEHNCVYVMVIEGSARIEDEILHRRDALGIWNTTDVRIMAEHKADVLFIEIPKNS